MTTRQFHFCINWVSNMPALGNCAEGICWSFISTCTCERRDLSREMKAARDVMSADDIEIASQALRDLAQLIIRDRVDSGPLEGYMRSLLNKHLIELHSACRYEAMVVARCFAGLGALDVAGYLCERACELEQTSSAFAASMSRDLRKIPMNSVSSYHRFSPI